MMGRPRKLKAGSEQKNKINFNLHFFTNKPKVKDANTELEKASSSPQSAGESPPNAQQAAAEVVNNDDDVSHDSQTQSDSVNVSDSAASVTELSASSGRPNDDAELSASPTASTSTSSADPHHRPAATTSTTTATASASVTMVTSASTTSSKKRKRGASTATEITFTTSTTNEIVSVTDSELSSSDDDLAASARPSSSKKHKVASSSAGSQSDRRFNPHWRQEFKWLDTDKSKKVMYCRVCIEAGQKNSFTLGCNKLKRDSLIKHAKTSGKNGHKEALEVAKTKEASEKARKRTLKRNERAAIAQLRNVYWCAKNDLPNRMVPEVNELCKEQGLEILNLLGVDQHTNYSSMDSVHEMQEAIRQVITKELVEKLKDAELYSVMLDESTDISVSQNLLVCVRFVNSAGESETHFLKVKRLSGATAQIIYDAFKTVLSDFGLESHFVVGAATDGAANMTGRHSGFTAKLKSDVPYLISTHCIAHRLALAGGKAADDVPYLVKYQERVNNIYNYFEKSNVHAASLRQLYEIIKSATGESGTKFQQVFHTRWLSFQGALDALVRNYSALITCLLSDKQNGGRGGKAGGILQDVSSVKFLYVTYFLCDAVGILAHLCRTFQTSNIDLGSVNPSVNAAIRALEALTKTESRGRNFKEFLKIVPKEAQGEFVLNTAAETGHKMKDGQKLRDDADSACLKFIANCVENLKARFLTPQDQNILSAFSKVFTPEDYPEETSEDFISYGEAEVKHLVDHYMANDLLHEDPTFKVINDSLHEFSTFKQMVVSHFRKTASTFKLLCKLLITRQAEQFPGLAVLAKIALTLPVSTVDVERGFSYQNLIKVRTRSRLLPDNLDKLMMIKIEGPPMKQFDFNKALDAWGEAKPRRLLTHY